MLCFRGCHTESPLFVILNHLYLSYLATSICHTESPQLCHPEPTLFVILSRLYLSSWANFAKDLSSPSSHCERSDAIAFPSSVIARRAQPDEAIASNVFLSFGGSIEGGFRTPSNIEHPPQYSTQKPFKGI